MLGMGDLLVNASLLWIIGDLQVKACSLWGIGDLWGNLKFCTKALYQLKIAGLHI